MRLFLVFTIFLAGTCVHAQNTIYSYAVGNWRNGPIVYISPLIETTEAFTTPQLIEGFKNDHPEFRDPSDIDVLRFATIEEGEENRRTLKAKYGVRKLKVVMLEPASGRTVPSPGNRE